jgi:hypothetical protein
VDAFCFFTTWHPQQSSTIQQLLFAGGDIRKPIFVPCQATNRLRSQGPLERSELLKKRFWTSGTLKGAQ